ncbi:hypothetical protein D3C81_1529370 [compost metagenome]
MGLPVEMRHIGQLLPGNAQQIGMVEVACGYNHRTGGMGCFFSQPVQRFDNKASIRLRNNRRRLLIGPDADLAVLGYIAVIGQRLQAVRLIVGGGKGVVSDLQQLRSAEKLHVSGILADAVGDHMLFQKQGIKPCTLQLNPGGQAAGTRSDNNDLFHGLNLRQQDFVNQPNHTIPFHTLPYYCSTSPEITRSGQKPYKVML